MGRDQNENGGRKPKKPYKPATGQNKAKSFHPTATEKAELKDGAMGISEAIELLAGYIRTGDYRISVTSVRRGDNVCASIREVTEDWKDAEMLSCFHSEAEAALRGLAYALAGRYANWPTEYPADTPPDFGW